MGESLCALLKTFTFEMWLGDYFVPVAFSNAIRPPTTGMEIRDPDGRIFVQYPALSSG